MLNISFTPFPVLETARLQFRQMSETSVRGIFDIRTNDTVNKYIHRIPPASIEEIEAYIIKMNDAMEKHGQCIIWAISLKGQEDCMATICYFNISEENKRAEIGFEMHPDHFGKGYMQEAIEVVMEYGFDTMKLQGLNAYAHKDNKRSIKLLEKNGFMYDESIRLKDLSDFRYYLRRREN
jgi:ribosomal-protein-alanine N-acetyltransferase